MRFIDASDEQKAAIWNKHYEAMRAEVRKHAAAPDVTETGIALLAYLDARQIKDSAEIRAFRAALAKAKG